MIAATAAAALVACGVGAGSARATEWMFCSDSESAVEVGLLLGQADMISIAAATITHGDTSFTTNEVYGAGKPIRLGHVSAGRKSFATDFAASDGQPVGKVVLTSKKRGSSTTYKGKLTLFGAGSWTVSCDDE